MVVQVHLYGSTFDSAHVHQIASDEKSFCLTASRLMRFGFKQSATHHESPMCLIAIRRQKSFGEMSRVCRSRSSRAKTIMPIKMLTKSSSTGGNNSNVIPRLEKITIKLTPVGSITAPALSCSHTIQLKIKLAKGEMREARVMV